jgi:hypothetical protein
MDGDKPRYWFPAKRYGWGWGPPSTWEGWVVMIVWLVIILSVTPWLSTENPELYYVFLALMFGAIISICWAKGEPPKWRWGKRD